MNIIEPHIHMYSRTTDDYQAMYDAGIRVVVEPSFWLGAGRRYAGTFFDYFQLLLTFEPVRAARYGVDHYSCISLNPKEAQNPLLVNEVLGGMVEYLDHPRCIAVGEIGLDQISGSEIDAFRRQLLIAEERNMPVLVHLPHINKAEGARILVDIIRAEGATQKRIEIDHNTEETLEITRATDCFTGLTVYPYSKLNPQRVSEIVRRWGADRMIIDGTVNLGTVSLHSGNVFADVPVVLHKTGSHGTYYRIITSENAICKNVPQGCAFDYDEQSITLNVNIGDIPAQSGHYVDTITIDNLDICANSPAGRGSRDGDDVIVITYSVLSADVTGDGHVDLFDLLDIADSWLTVTPSVNVADGPYDAPGIINLLDFLVLANEWDGI